MSFVKPEPREFELPPADNIISRHADTNAFSVVKDEQREPDVGPRSMQQAQPKEEERVNIIKTEQSAPGVSAGEDATLPPPAIRYERYDNVSEIAFTPEDALKQGMLMCETIQDRINRLRLGSKMRQDVWKRDLDNLRSQHSPTTLIAVCGATGAGKSSILNAILDDNIVPTSGMRACTAVVTEISHHKKNTIEADVSFLSEEEWRQELTVLLPDLLDENDKPKRVNDLKSDAGIAWHKVHALYPALSVERLVRMSPDEIINHDSAIRNILGTTKKIVSKDSKAFGKEIAKYIDSKDQKRGDSKGKKDKKNKSKSKGKSTMDKVRAAAGKQAALVRGGKQGESATESDVALWPLIRKVAVRCPSKALSTGAILVDLPGVADANAARSNIAKDYMKKANCIWILAPITRAVDDKTAKDLLGDAFKMQLLMDGNYDDHCITFIASKCDDISCSEVIHALQLYDEPELSALEQRIEDLDDQIRQNGNVKKNAEKGLKMANVEGKDLRDRLKDHKNHLQALKSGELYVSKFAENRAPKRKDKRQSHGGRSSKRRRSAGSDDEEHSISEPSSSGSEEEEDSESGSDSSSEAGDDDDDDSDEEGRDSNSDEDEEYDSDDSPNESGSESVIEVENLAINDETEQTLKAKIASVQDALRANRRGIEALKEEKASASDKIGKAQRLLGKVQREKNAFCSKKRSEFSRDVLKEDFRTGLKELDDAAAEERDPDNFNPAINLRDYNAIDLPVFTCSSRDYVRLQRQVKGDGDPTCFSNTADTGIPELQKWCHALTMASRERSSRNLLTQLQTFAQTVQSYVQGIGEVTPEDREALRALWESEDDAVDDEQEVSGNLDGSDDEVLGRLWGRMNAYGGHNLYTMDEPPKRKEKKVNENGDSVGISNMLCTEFVALSDKCVEDLNARFKDGLEDRCRAGAAASAANAVDLIQTFIGTVHWQTFRATLRRWGVWRGRDLNIELVTPFTRSIAHSWSQIFESDMFSQFETSTIEAIKKLLDEVVESAAPGLKDRAQIQRELCLEEARVAFESIMNTVRDTMTEQQKEISRLLGPHVQQQLVEGYNETLNFRGTGSVARQKTFFREHVDDRKDEIFEDGADVIMGRLESAAAAVGEALDESLGDLAQKIEVNISVLWEGFRDDPTQVSARKDVVFAVADVQKQVQLWLQAASAQQEVELRMDMDEEDQNHDQDIEMN